MNKFFHNKKNRNLLVVGLIIVVLPLTIFQALHQQELRQRAGGGASPISPPYPTSITPGSSREDINNDGFVDIIDFNMWKDEFIRRQGGNESSSTGNVIGP